jgi:hypothetical protein
VRSQQAHAVESTWKTLIQSCVINIVCVLCEVRDVDTPFEVVGDGYAKIRASRGTCCSIIMVV